MYQFCDTLWVVPVPQAESLESALLALHLHLAMLVVVLLYRQVKPGYVQVLCREPRTLVVALAYRRGPQNPHPQAAPGPTDPCRYVLEVH